MTMASLGNLASWGERKNYLAHAPNWATRGARGGAPSPPVRLDSGEWVIFYQANPRVGCEGGSPCGCIGSAHASSPAGPFTPGEQPVICMPTERGLVDGSARRLALTSGGQPQTVLYFKSTGFNTLARPARLWVVVLNDRGTQPSKIHGGPINLLNQTASWEARGGRGCIEAPALYHDAAKQTWTLFYSGGDWTAGIGPGQTPYSIGYAKCASPLGPCTKHTVNRPWFGPAYNDSVGVGGQEVLTGADGVPWLVFHSWKRGHAGYGNGGRRAVSFYPLAMIEAIAGPL